MKKLFIIAIFFSLALSQTCPYDGSGLRYRTGNIKTPRDGYISYEWVCEGDAVGSNRHNNWSEEKIPNPVGADSGNSYQQQQQQQQQPQQQVGRVYDPLEGAFQDKRTDEEKRKDDEEMAQFVSGLKKTKLGTVFLYTIRAGILYAIYVFATDN